MPIASVSGDGAVASPVEASSATASKPRERNRAAAGSAANRELPIPMKTTRFTSVGTACERGAGATVEVEESRKPVGRSEDVAGEAVGFHEVSSRMNGSTAVGA